MFLDVKRIKQRLDINESKEILDETLRGSLSINGLNGYPYVMPLNHYYDIKTNRLYFHGGKIGYKIDCINIDNRCSYNVIKETKSNDWYKVFESVIVFGKIHFENDINEIIRISKLLSYKFIKDDNYIDNEIKESLNNTLMFYIEIEHITGKIVNER